MLEAWPLSFSHAAFPHQYAPQHNEHNATTPLGLMLTQCVF